MMNTHAFLSRRIEFRDAQLEGIVSAARELGATALHLYGSLARGIPDALSDIDVWLTFPDDLIEAALGQRQKLFAVVGEIMLIHEMHPNRPPGGAYALVLYETTDGPMQIDWSLAPQRSSRVGPEARAIFEFVDVPIGDQPFDESAEQNVTLSERIDWFTAMLFIAGKAIYRGSLADFLLFLGEVYPALGEEFGLAGLTTSDPVDFASAKTMLLQLAPYADQRQTRAIGAVTNYLDNLESLDPGPARLG